MLYVSTRDGINTYTSHVAVTRDVAADGGRFVPFRMPVFSVKEILQMKDKSFNQVMADVLNLFFCARFTSWDMDFCIGKSTCRHISMNHKIIVCELWHNPDTSFLKSVQRIGARLSSEECPTSPWVKIAVRIAAFFAAYAQVLAEGTLQEGSRFDLVVSSDELHAPVAAYLAKLMGLPVDTVICACCEEGSIWDLIQKGSFNPAGVSEELILGLETLICFALGPAEAARFRSCCANRRTFSFGEDNPFAGQFYCTVAGASRAENTINSLFRSNQYVIDPVGALCVSGLQDYRSGSGAGRVALLLCEDSPLNHSRQICAATGILESKLAQYVKL